jgi:hypothetical protein
MKQQEQQQQQQWTVEPKLPALATVGNLVVQVTTTTVVTLSIA